MAQIKRLEDLEVFRLAEELADAVWDLVKRWPNLARDTVGKQLVRAADSVGANIAEGYGRYSFTEKRQFTRIARGSLYETRYWLRRAYRRELMSQEEQQRIKPLLDRLPQMLNAFLNSLDRRTHHPNNE